VAAAGDLARQSADDLLSEWFLGVLGKAVGAEQAEKTQRALRPLIEGGTGPPRP
jgi:hypothetical protein